MICHSNRSNPLTGHRYGLSENLTAVTLRPLTGHRKRRQSDSDSLREHPLTGHRFKHTVIRQETGMNGMLTFRPCRDPHFYQNNSTRVVLSLQSVDFVESSARDMPTTETFSVYTERNMRTAAEEATPVMTPADNASMVTSGDENLPVAESQASLYSHRRSPRRSLSMRSERSSLYAERSTVKALHGTTSMTSDRSPNRPFGFYSRPSSVCTESSVFGTRTRWETSSSEKMPTVTLLGRGRNRTGDEDEELNESVESLELVPLESARLELERNDLEEFGTKIKDEDAERKRKATVSLTQTKAMIQSLGNRLRKSLRRSKSNLESKSKSDLTNGKHSTQRPLSAQMGGNFSSLYASLKSEVRPSSTSALSKTLDNNRCTVDFEKSVSMKSVVASNSSEKTPKRSFLKNSKSSLNASKEAIKNTYVNLVAPVKCLAKDDNHLEDIARSKENTRKSIKHANSNLESVNMKEPVIIRSTGSLDRRSRPSSRTENSIESNETKSSRSKIDISGLTIKRLEDKPSGIGCDVIGAYLPVNENPSTFNGLKQHSIHDISSKTPPLLPSYRPPPSEPVKTPNSVKSNRSSSKKRNSSDLSVSSFEDNENQPRVHLPTNLKRRARVTKRPPKKRANTELLCNGCTATTESSTTTTTTTTTTAEIACLDPQKNSDKTPIIRKRREPGSNDTSGSSTPTANTPNGKLGTAHEKRSKFMYCSERKGAPEPIPVPPPIPGTLKPEFRQSKEITNNNSASNHNVSNGRISRTPPLQPKPERKVSLRGPTVPVGSSGTDMSESGSTPTPKRPLSGPVKGWSRPVSTISTLSNSSNDKCNNFEQLLKEIVSRRTKLKKDSIENLPAT